MQFKSVKNLIKPLIKGGQQWQYISISGIESPPKFYFSDIQWFMIFISSITLLSLKNGIPEDILNTVIAAFSISVSLFMSLLVSIFDKFENTSFELIEKSDKERARLVVKKNFFKRFISITSYLVVISIFIIVLCCVTYLFNLNEFEINTTMFVNNFKNIDIVFTIKCTVVIIYRFCLNYFLLNYLFMTIFIAGSAYEYYMSEINNKKII